MNTKEDLVRSLLEEPSTIAFVNRRLLIETIGIEQAEQFLPQLPEQVGVNKEHLMLVIRTTKPDLVHKVEKSITNGKR